jgi:hypothetical protein
VAPRAARRRRDRGGAGFLEHLLVPALQRTVPLADMHDLAVMVGEDLQLDMARLVEVFFEVHGVVAEGGPGFGARFRPRGLKLPGIAGNLHAAPAAAGRRLDQDGVFDRLRDLARLLKRLQLARRARHQRHTEGRHRGLGGDLVAHHPDMLTGRPDEDEVMRLHHLREGRVLGQEAVAGMDRLRACDQGGGEDRRHVEVGIARERRADAYALIGEADMHGVDIGGRVHGDGGDAELPAGALHAQRDFTAIGDEDFFEHAGPLAIR